MFIYIKIANGYYGSILECPNKTNFNKKIQIDHIAYYTGSIFGRCPIPLNIYKHSENFSSTSQAKKSLENCVPPAVRSVETSASPPRLLYQGHGPWKGIHPCLMSRLSRLLSVRPVGCQHTATSLTKTPLFDVKTVKTSVLTTCRLPTYSYKFDKNTPV